MINLRAVFVKGKVCQTIGFTVDCTNDVYKYAEMFMSGWKVVSVEYIA